ncbi:MAG: chromosomal replication initiator protein DnaA [Deltaproteobacteria bacterium]|nr:chromosomal replication initiator protein DnaA [Deltaproteobacteria bacterium]MBW2215844.1 chromosomal replication initiator protein DnaA [Deltaproteobacteria bacterium]
MKATWKEVKTYIQTGLPENTFSLWIDPITFLENGDNTVVLGCPNKFSSNWVEENYSGLIKDQFLKAGAGHVDLVFKVGPKKKGTSSPVLSSGPEQLMLPNMPEKGRTRKIRLNSDFTFNKFVVGPSNEFAYSASRAMSKGGTWTYNSLMMLANTGLGKSHLSQAIGHAILEQAPQSRVLYVTAEDFANDMISSLKNNSIEQFKNKYRRSCDVLLLEEVHFLSGKEKMQAELGYTLDALGNDNKKVIFTSSLSPKDIPRMSKELSSRLASGLVTTIDGPDYETRVNIISNKASEHNIRLTKEIIHFLASRLTKDVRQMESALKCLKAKSELVKARIDLDLAKDVVACLISGEDAISSEDIMKVVSKYYKIDPDMLRSKSRKRTYAYPRKIYVYLCRSHTRESMEKIAKTVNRSHSMVVYAYELVERNMRSDDKMRREIEFLSKRIDNLKK